MSSPTPPAAPPPLQPAGPRELKVIAHSTLFYWWPVWVFGFFFALWTNVENNRLAVVPADTGISEVKAANDVPTSYMLTTGKELPRPLARAVEYTSDGVDQTVPFPVHVSSRAWLGSLFVLILLIVIGITNVPLRGLWSFITIMAVVVVALFITLFHGWDEIYERVSALRVYINMAGYLFIATAVFVLWAVATFVFDRRTYIIFSPGQIKVCEHIGDSIRTYDTVGMTFEKQRDDLFRHYILGFGSGDLVVRTAGAERHEIKLANVLGVGWQLKAIEALLREKTTVAA